MVHIQPPARDNSRSDIDAAVIPGLITADRHAASGLSAVAQELRITAAPKHPGRDPVSLHIVEELVAVLRGEGGIEPRLTALTGRLLESANKLNQASRTYENTDAEAARAFGRLHDED